MDIAAPFIPTDQDRQLLLEIAQGNQLAFQSLYEKNHRALYRYTLRFAKSPELTQDVVQDTFVKIWEKREQLTHIQNINAFLFTVCRNQLLNVFTRASREAALQEEITRHLVCVHSTTEEAVFHKQYEAIAEEAIAKLPPQRQQIFRQCRLEGRSYEEVATELGISRYTVNDHLVKASKFLRAYVSAYADYSLLFFFLPYLFLN